MSQGPYLETDYTEISMLVYPGMCMAIQRSLCMRESGKVKLKIYFATFQQSQANFISLSFLGKVLRMGQSGASQFLELRDWIVKFIQASFKEFPRRKMYKFQPWIPSHKYLIVFSFKLSAHISVYNTLTFGNSSLCPGVVPVKYASKILIQISPRLLSFMFCCWSLAKAC